MRGSDRAAGGVALVTRTRHPVAAAVALLDEPEVLLAGASADAHAAAHGLEQCDPAEFVTERQRQRLAKKLAGGARPSERSASTPPACSPPPPRPAAFRASAPAASATRR